MVAILFLTLPLLFAVLGYFGQWKMTASIIGLLILWLGYVLYLHWTGDPNDPSLSEHGAQVFPYFLGTLIVGICLAHSFGWGARYLKTQLANRRARSKLGETFE